jgi:hypothetical protein
MIKPVLFASSKQAAIEKTRCITDNNIVVMYFNVLHESSNIHNSNDTQVLIYAEWLRMCAKP